MLNQVFIGTALTAITAGAVAAYRHHQWRKYHIIDNHKEIDRKYAESDILSISAKIAERIDESGFKNCRSLEEANFPKATSIGFRAFKECKQLKEANIPEATSIGHYGFQYCTSLEEANFPELTSIGLAAFYFCRSLKKACFPKVTSVGRGGFSFCESLEEANFPKATSIGDEVFCDCKSLKEANFPKVTSVGRGGFSFCESLEEANFPEATSIGYAAFSACTSLKVAYFPKTTSIDHSAFSNCSNLQTIILPDSLFDNNVVTDEWKEQRRIREDAQCIRHRDYLQSIEEINNLIGQERFSQGDDKILELQLLQKIHKDEEALPGKLSDDEKNMLMRIPESGVLKSDVYKMVKSIKGDDYERKKEWAKFLGVKVEVSKAKTENSGEAEDSKETLIRQQLETIALEIELEKMIVKCEEPIHEYLSLKEIMSLEQTSIGGNIGLPIQFNSERTERESKLKEYKKQLDDYMKKPENSMEKTKNSKSLDSIAESVQLLFEEVTQSNNQSPIAKA